MRPKGNMDKLDDIYYIRKTLDGEIEFFSRLVDRYSRQVYLLILKIVRQKEDAEELTQDVFIKAFKVLSSFKGECRFSTWLYRIAYNQSISATRKKRYEFLYIEEETIRNVEDQAVNDALSETDSVELLLKLNRALELLLPDERGLISLFYMEEHTIDEIADITELTATNVKVKLHRIRKKLYVIINGMSPSV